MQAEKLESRQVLSVANVAVVMNVTPVCEPEPKVPGLDVSTPAQTNPGSEVDIASAQDGKVAWTSSVPSWAQFDLSGNHLTTLSTVVRNSVQPNVDTGDLTTSRDVTSTSGLAPPAYNEPLSSAIDEVFHDSGDILDSSLPSSVITEPDSTPAASTVLPVPEDLTPSPNNPTPVIAVPEVQIVVPIVQSAARSLPATSSVFVIPVAESSVSVSVSSTSSQSSGWNWRTSSQSEFAARTLQTATVAARPSQTVPASAARSAGCRSIVSPDGDLDHAWLAVLTEFSWFSTNDNTSTPGISSSTGSADTLPVAVPLVNDSVDQQLSPQNLTITAQTKVKPFREGHRQNSTSTKLVEVAHQHDSLPDLIDSEDVPRALRYVVLPRGPPRKQPETVLRIMDSDAEAHVLQRLRYSMAPRGPSTVTVEMQSPEKRSFSGPRVSPEESLSVRLVC